MATSCYRLAAIAQRGAKIDVTCWVKPKKGRLLSGPLAVEFRRFLHDELALDDTPNPTVPGEGACLVPAPG